MIILGIDPGSTLIGFAAIEEQGDKLEALNYGLVKIVSKDSNEKLIEISQEIKALLKKTNPDLVGLEKLFFAKNKKTALEVAQARGVIALEILQSNRTIVELTPIEVKSLVTGYGGSDKRAVAKMATAILATTNAVKEDNTTDALAIAIAASVKNKELK